MKLHLLPDEAKSTVRNCLPLQLHEWSRHVRLERNHPLTLDELGLLPFQKHSNADSCIDG
jgi:hypothetical protein